jgi:hypothetical protein
MKDTQSNIQMHGMQIKLILWNQRKSTKSNGTMNLFLNQWDLNQMFLENGKYRAKDDFSQQDLEVDGLLDDQVQQFLFYVGFQFVVV